MANVGRHSHHRIPGRVGDVRAQVMSDRIGIGPVALGQALADNDHRLRCGGVFVSQLAPPSKGVWNPRK
jgi:hypothetical protein